MTTTNTPSSIRGYSTIKPITNGGYGPTPGTGLGSSTYVGLDDVNIPTPSDGLTTHYDASQAKFVQVPEMKVTPASRNIAFDTTGAFGVVAAGPAAVQSTNADATLAGGAGATVIAATGPTLVQASAGKVTVGGENIDLLTNDEPGKVEIGITGEPPLVSFQPGNLTAIAATGYVNIDPQSLATKQYVDDAAGMGGTYASLDDTNVAAVGDGTISRYNPTTLKYEQTPILRVPDDRVVIDAEEIDSTTGARTRFASQLDVVLQAETDLDMRSITGPVTINADSAQFELNAATNVTISAGTGGPGDATISAPTGQAVIDAIEIRAKAGDGIYLTAPGIIQMGQEGAAQQVLTLDTADPLTPDILASANYTVPNTKSLTTKDYVDTAVSGIDLSTKVTKGGDADANLTMGSTIGKTNVVATGGLNITENGGGGLVSISAPIGGVEVEGIEIFAKAGDGLYMTAGGLIQMGQEGAAQQVLTLDTADPLAPDIVASANYTVPQPKSLATKEYVDSATSGVANKVTKGGDADAVLTMGSTVGVTNLVGTTGTFVRDATAVSLETSGNGVIGFKQQGDPDVLTVSTTAGATTITGTTSGAIQFTGAGGFTAESTGGASTTLISAKAVLATAPAIELEDPSDGRIRVFNGGVECRVKADATGILEVSKPGDVSGDLYADHAMVLPRAVPNVALLHRETDAAFHGGAFKTSRKLNIASVLTPSTRFTLYDSLGDNTGDASVAVACEFDALNIEGVDTRTAIQENLFTPGRKFAMSINPTDGQVSAGVEALTAYFLVNEVQNTPPAWVVDKTTVILITYLGGSIPPVAIADGANCFIEQFAPRELGDIEGVDTTGATDGDFLRYDAADATWEVSDRVKTTTAATTLSGPNIVNVAATGGVSLIANSGGVDITSGTSTQTTVGAWTAGSSTGNTTLQTTGSGDIVVQALGTGDIIATTTQDLSLQGGASVVISNPTAAGAITLEADDVRSKVGYLAPFGRSFLTREILDSIFAARAVATFNWTGNASLTPLTQNVPTPWISPNVAIANPINQTGEWSAQIIGTPGLPGSTVRYTFLRTGAIDVTFRVALNAEWRADANDREIALQTYINGSATGVPLVVNAHQDKPQAAGFSGILEISDGGYFEFYATNIENDDDLLVPTASVSIDEIILGA